MKRTPIVRPVEFERLNVLAKELNLVSKDLIIPLLHAAEKQKLDQIERAYHPGHYGKGIEDPGGFWPADREDDQAPRAVERMQEVLLR